MKCNMNEYADVPVCQPILRMLSMGDRFVILQVGVLLLGSITRFYYSVLLLEYPATADSERGKRLTIINNGELE